MAVESTTPEITSLPSVVLPDLNGSTVDVNVLAEGKPTVVVFVCNHCPYVQSIEDVLGEISAQRNDVTWIGICSNDATEYPDDDVPGLQEQAQRAGWTFPYLVDADQSVAKAFGAVCTPDFFVFAPDGTLVYRGAMDDARPRQPQPVDAVHLLSALDSAKAGKPFEGGKPAMGCGIKWLEG